MKTFLSARLRSYRFSRRPVCYGLIALLFILFPPIRRRAIWRRGIVVRRAAEHSESLVSP